MLIHDEHLQPQDEGSKYFGSWISRELYYSTDKVMVFLTCLFNDVMLKLHTKVC